MSAPAVEKQIMAPAVALAQAGITAVVDARGDNGGARSKGAPPASAKFHFVKNFGVGDVFKFKDGTTFKFRLISRNNNRVFAPNSFLKTDDEKLAANLREMAKNPAWGIVEIAVK
jgi:hypothetical protein